VNKWIVVLIATLGLMNLSQPANAQRFSAGAAITLFGPGGSALGFGISGNFAALELVKFGVLNIDARATLDIDFNFGVEFNFSGFARFNLRSIDVYAGPTVSILLGYGFGFGATLGIRSSSIQPVGVFGELEFLFVPAALRFRVGVNILV
jgi:hypothetical protein